MSPDPRRWKRAGDLMVAALETPPEGRDAFLETACQGDGALRQEVEALLQYHESAEGFLSQPPALPGLDEPGSLAGRRIGSYRLLNEVGRGGMGTVYLAVRGDGVHDVPVALKVIRGGREGGEVVRRFENERRILAALRHPGIARLFDGGTTDDGLPYFVMEYVPGKPILDYCEERALDVAARLELFRAVCEAVQYAHQSLVVHRDLKPANILVDADGQPKLLDFGIAKLLGTDASASVTVTDRPPFTPSHASPEQVRGEPVTASSDVYSLGMLLFELLTGQLPYAVAGLSAAEVERVVCSAEPPRPSTAARPARRIPSELDSIVLKALRKEPEARYATVRELSEDVHRFLTGLPVRARPSGLAYRARKFVRRHRLGVAAAAAFLAVIAGLSAFYLVRVRRERDAARREAAKAEATAEFLVRLFEASDPFASAEDANQLTAQAVLQRGTERIAGELAGQPEVRAKLLVALGRIHVRLGLYERAAALLSEALAVQRRVLGADHQDVAQTLHELAVLSTYTGDYSRAESLYREAIALRRRVLGPASEPTAASLNGLCGALRYRGDLAGAEESCREALAIRRRKWGERHEDVAESLKDLAAVREGRGDLDEAEALTRESRRIYGEVVGEEHPMTLRVLNDLALVLYAKGDLDGAEAHLRRVIEFSRKHLGDAHPDTTSQTGNLAAVLHAKGDLDGAEPLLRQVLRMDQRHFGPEHPDVATDLHNLARLLLDKDDPAGAERMARQALEMRRKLLGPTHLAVAKTLDVLAGVARAKGDLEGARALHQEVLALRRRTLPPDHPDLAFTYLGLGQTLLALGHPSEAEPLLRDSLRIRKKALRGNHYLLALSKSGLGSCLLAERQYAEAEPLLTEAHETLRSARRQDRRAEESVLRSLIALYTETGNREQVAVHGQRLEATRRRPPKV